jgi:hypothetical protein
MNVMVFKDTKHQEFYEENITKTKAEKDPYRKSFFYALGLTNDTRRNIEDLYDFHEGGLIPEGLRQPWQTGTSMRVTRLAFNLFNDYDGEGAESGDFTPSNIFCDGLMAFFFEAVKLRYPEYYHSLNVS